MNRLAALNCQIFDTESLIWKRPTKQSRFLSQTPTIEDILGPYHKFHTAAPLLRKINCINIDQVTDNNGQLLEYKDIKKRAGLNSRGRLPRWYKDLKCKEHTTPIARFKLPETLNNHPRKWKSSTERITEIIGVNHQEPYFTATSNLFLEIDPDHTQHWLDAKQLLATSQHPELTFYTDGSLKHVPEDQTDQIKMGAAWINQETGETFRHHVQTGNASSTNPEMVAVLSALEASPTGKNIHIVSDSQAVVYGVKSIITGKYWDTPISHILKRPEWVTWEAIALTIQNKRPKCRITKVEAHTGDTYNETADKLAKEATFSNLAGRSIYIHHNTAISRTSFQLAMNYTLVTGNIRKHIKHTSQNIHRGEWVNHWTANRLKEAANHTDIDWRATKAAFNVDGGPISGFTTAKTSFFKSYVTKLLTGTLPTADILHSKWELYQSDQCARCRETPESNEHIWICRRAKSTIMDISTRFINKHRLSDTLKPDVERAISGIISTNLTKALKTARKRDRTQNAREETTSRPAPDSNPEAIDSRIDTDNIYGDILWLIRKGHQEVWKKRSHTTIETQKSLGIKAGDKNPQRSKLKRKQKAQNQHQEAISTQTDEQPRVVVNHEKLNSKYDAFRCKCSLHSLIHSPGIKCSNEGLVTYRAGNIALSCIRRQQPIIPYIISRSVLRVGGPNH